MTDLSTTLPVCILDFPGFYESRLDAISNYELERLAEYEAEKMKSAEFYPETYQPKELRLDADEIGGFAFDFVDYRKVESRIVKDWLRAYADSLSRSIHTTVGLTFEKIESPREYNFTTDRLFALVSLDSIGALFALSAAEDHKHLRDIVAERFESRSGFCSFYSSDLDDWLEKTVFEWDHNELGTLLEAVAAIGGEDPIEDATYYCEEASGSNGDYIDEGMDWSAFEAKILESIEEKRAELPEDHELFKPSTRNFFPSSDQKTFNFKSEC